MYQSALLEILRDTRFYSLLFDFDRDLAEEAKKGCCPHCGAVMHRGNYRRKPRGQPRGEPSELPPELATRFSLCCSDCRNRLTPPSIRFLGRKVYLGVVVVLAAAMMQGPSPRRAARLEQALGVSRRTLERWRLWWRDRFAPSRFFTGLRGLLRGAIDATLLPLSLLESAGTPDWREATLTILKLLMPITSTSAPGSQAL